MLSHQIKYTSPLPVHYVLRSLGLLLRCVN